MVTFWLSLTLLRASNYEQKVFLVSDALAPIGLPEGVYPWDKREIIIKNGTARLKDGTLAGTTRGLLTGVENLVKWGICGVGEAIALATETPRKALGLKRLERGEEANLLIWKWNHKTKNLTWKRIKGT